MSYPFLPLIETAFPVDARVTPSRVRPSDVPAAGTVPGAHQAGRI